MKKTIIFFFLLVHFLAGCVSLESEEPFAASIKALKSDEVLYATVLSCHRGCSASTIKFTNGEASLTPRELTLSADEISELESRFAGSVVVREEKDILGSPTLSLTAKEIEDLDSYFLLGDDPRFSCSNIIRITFEHKKRRHVLNSKDFQVYPCISGDEQVSPSKLLVHLEEIKSEVPYWRMSEDERQEMLKSHYSKKTE